MQFRRIALIMTAAAAVVAVTGAGTEAQISKSVSVPVDANTLRAHPAPPDHRYHIFPAQTEAGLSMTSKQLGNHPLGMLDQAVPSPKGIGPSAQPGALPIIGQDPPPFAPPDLAYFGGAVVQRAVSFDIYLNCSTTDGTCWGNPSTFLSDLFSSTFIHVLDQYTFAGTSNNRYVQSGTFVTETGSVPHVLSAETDIPNLVSAAVNALGLTNPAYIAFFHLFLPSGQDVCFSNGACYSPDAPANFVFCAYHSSVTISGSGAGTGHIVYSVEPFQNVNGCLATQSGPSPTPNGILSDSTASTLSHETFELISDPDGNAWLVPFDVVLGGSEIGDDCVFRKRPFVISPWFINAPWQVQLEYSNAIHACATKP
jgi:hypothetical protein